MSKVTKRGDRYVLDYYHEGRRARKTLKTGTLKADAERQLREIMESIDDGSYTAPKKVPLFSEVSEKWMALKKTSVRDNTYKQYKSHVNQHLDPYFGHKKISAVNLDMVEDYIADADTNIVTLKKFLSIWVPSVIMPSVNAIYATILSGMQKNRSRKHSTMKKSE